MRLSKLQIFLACAFIMGCSAPSYQGDSAQRSVTATDAGPMVPNDPYMWLENSANPKTMEWVHQHDAKSTQALMTDTRYNGLASQIREIITAQDRIPTPGIRNGKIRNFWEDSTYVRGIWRQTTPREFAMTDPTWDILLNVDDLNKKENKSWVFEGAECLPPADNLCLLSLSDGGRDEVVVREFNVAKKSFVTGGFVVPSAKSQVAWVDKNTVLLGTDFGPGSLTKSGYPRQMKIWKRGTPISMAKLIFEGTVDDVSVSGEKNFRPESGNIFLHQSPSFFESKNFIYERDGSLKKIPFPVTADFMGDFQNFLFVRLRDDWQTPSNKYLAGSLLSLPIKAVGTPDALSRLEVVYEPDGRSSFSAMNTSKNFLYIELLRNVRGEIDQVVHSNHSWTMKKLPLPDDGMPSVTATDNFSDLFFVSYETFTVPPTLFMGKGKDLSNGLTKVKALAPKYDASDIVMEQFQSTSKDGTQIPYFVIHKKDYPLNGTNPTLLYAYGGFEISETPFYLGAIGKVWLEKGGVYALANIRGGGEFGPQWHQAALKENRQRAYDDFASVAQDLVTRGITSTKKLAIQGGSNGGLLMGVAFTQHPDYYAGVVCESALLDMLRYTKLPPGASWIAEYGDPDDPHMAEIISRYSPYQNVKPGVKYPKVFFHISTADDRVQPGHTRKMVARMEEYGNDVLMYENTEGGHGGAADLEQRVTKAALEYTYLYQQIMN